MDHNLNGLSQEQQNLCRAALQEFIDRHGLSAWEMTVKVQEVSPGALSAQSVQIEITPPQKPGSIVASLKEMTVVDSTSDFAATVKTLLEAAYRAHCRETITH
jgi:hypothetical protein